MDTSGMVRRYDGSEPGAHTVRSLCDPDHGNLVFISRLVRLELRAALRRKLEEGVFTQQRAAETWAAFLEHEAYDYRVVPLSEAVLNEAEGLIERRHPLRAADAVHVASALSIAPSWGRSELLFVTADRRQAQAAEAEGMDVQFIV